MSKSKNDLLKAYPTSNCPREVQNKEKQRIMSNEREYGDSSRQRASSSAVPPTISVGGAPQHYAPAMHNNAYNTTAPGSRQTNGNGDPYHATTQTSIPRHGRHRSMSAVDHHGRRYPYSATYGNPVPPSTEQSHTNADSKEIYQYNAPWPVYALDWCKIPHEQRGFRMAVGSIIEDSHNKLQVIARTDMMEGAEYAQNIRRMPDFTVAAETDVYYPITKVLWEPWRGDSRRSDLLATTGDILRIWELVDHPRYSTNNSINSSSGQKSPAYYTQQLVKKAELANMKQADFCAPLTSFDWNETDPSLIVTSSIDTTCTVWNVETNQPKTQLIAHDSDVYDVAFMHGSPDIFASVGADGSVRLFDLRALEHSTILYEAPPSTPSVHQVAGDNASASTNTSPLLRLQFSPKNTNLIATFQMDSSSVQILDIRYPSTPVAELVKGHQRSINGISWSPVHQGQLCTGGDDGQVLVWDINNTAPSTDHITHRQQYYPQQPQQPQQRYNQHPTRSVQDPILAYTAESEVSSLSWSKGVKDWIGIGFGRTIQALRV